MNHGYRLADWKAELDAAAAEASASAAAAAAVAELDAEGAATRSLSGQWSGITTAGSASETAGGGGGGAGFGRIANAVDVRVYAVTDAGTIERSGRSLGAAILLAIDGGASVVQLREKGCDSAQHAQRAASALAACRSAGVPLIINDRVDIALAVGADGVHVGQDDLPAATVRRLIGPDMVLGVSVKSVEDAVRAEAAGADYLGAGAVYPSGTKQESSVIGLDGLREICAAVRIPVVPIGGVEGATAAAAVAAGAAGVAVVSAIFEAGNPADAARALRTAVDAALEERQVPGV